MIRDKDYDDLLRKRISDIMGEPVDEDTNKVSMIAQQIGQCPVMSFGNSAGDISMTNFVMGNEKYKTAAFFVCCDDEVRENGSLEKAQKVHEFCAENGWTPISMKNDWLTVFGKGITKKQG